MSSVFNSQQLQELDCRDFRCIVGEVGELGWGLHSSVRMADHPIFGRVAIKCFVVPGGGPQKRRLEKKVKTELQMLQQAMNNYVVRIYGWVKWPGSMGLVMEYMAGGNLGQFISDGSFRLPLKVTLRVACETSEGIAFMHNLPTDQRAVHGDLKPENVLLSPDLHCKLSDFGCVQLISLTDCTITASGRPKETDLTLAYAAPEKLEDFNTAAKKEQDTYSFGMLLYVLLRGSTPYQHRSQESAFIELIKRGERPNTRPIDELKETLSNEDKQILETLQSIMKKCWQQDPSDRPTMIEVRDELQRLRRQQNDGDILKSVSEVLDTVSTLDPNGDDHQLLPLHHFSPMHGTFGQGTVHNIYNMPNVQQAAMECNAVEFQQAGPPDNFLDIKSPDREVPDASRSLLSRLYSFFAESESSTSSTPPANIVNLRHSRQQTTATTEDVDPMSTTRRSTTSYLEDDEEYFSASEEAETASSWPPAHNTEPQQRQQSVTTEETTEDDGMWSAESSTRSLEDDEEQPSTDEEREISTFAETSVKRAPGRKPTLSEVFESADLSALPRNVQAAQSLLEKYKVSLKNQNYEEAKTMTTAITSMIEDNIDATAKDVKEFGIKLREKKLFLESIFIFDAASAMFKEMGKTEESLEWVRICVEGMKDTNEAMIGDDASMKVFAKNYVIPLMREKLCYIEDMSSVSEQFKCLQVCWVLHYIEYSEGWVDELQEREKILRFALARMKDVFKSDVMKFELYGYLFNDLGLVCHRTSRFEEAASFFKQAIDVYKAATDYKDVEKKKRLIEESGNNLKIVQEKMK